MIGRLTGRLALRRPDRVLLDVAGVGYDLRIPLSTFYSLPADGDSTVRLHVHTHVRDDAFELFGFDTVQERTTFEQLIGISGVGPRLALAVLSGIGVDDLRAAVTLRDRERLERIPGIGRKTAERMLLELRDRLGTGSMDDGSASGPDSGQSDEGSVRADAQSALVNLGYSRQVAARAVARAVEEAPPASGIEALLKAALAGLVR